MTSLASETAESLAKHIERVLRGTLGTHEAVMRALDDLSELASRAAERDEAVKERDENLSVQAADEWLLHRFHEVCDERDRLAAALERIGAAELLADGDFGRELRARQDIAREALNPGDGA